MEKDWNPEDWQGRTEKQVKFTVAVVFVLTCIAVASSLIFVVYCMLNSK